MSAVAFWPLAALALASGVLVFRFDSMARATFALLTSFLAAAAEVILLGLSYLGVVIALMMVMEMLVMVVFMVMFMMNPAGLMPMQMLHNKRGSLVIAVGTFAVLATGILAVPWPQRAGPPPADPTFALGKALMGEHMLPMMVLGAALFATIVGTVVLATDRGRYDRLGDELDASRAADPIAGGVGR